MRQYYIVFETNSTTGWRIRNTKNNLDTGEGLLKEIEDFEKEFGKAVIFLYWKRMKTPFVNWLKNLR